MAKNFFENKTEPIGKFDDYGKTEPIGGFGNFGGSVPGMGVYETIPNDYVSPVSELEDSGLFPERKETDFGSWDGAGPSGDHVFSRGAGRQEGSFGFEDTTPSNEQRGSFFEDFGQTDVVGLDNSVPGYLPVVGWLVCIEGNDQGRDYRLHAGYNTIGKNPGNDICITGDSAVSRDRHAMIAYDQEENLFFFAPGNGVNLLRLNNKVLMTPTVINAYDILTIGRSKLIFIPLCSEAFKWGNQT